MDPAILDYINKTKRDILTITDSSLSDPNELMRELGLEKQKIGRTRRLMARTDPRQFDIDRTQAMQNLEQKISEAYLTSYNQYISAGFNRKEAKEKSMDVARVTKAKLEEAINSEFGNESNTIHEANQIVSKASDLSGYKF